MMYEFISGPMVWIAFGVFLVGLVVQGIRFFKHTSPKEPLYLPALKKKPDRSKEKISHEGGIIRRMFWAVERMCLPLTDYATRKYRHLRFSVVFTHPVMTVVTVVFHVFLFVTPLFLLAHNKLLENSILGFGLPSLSESTTDMLTIIFLACAFFFLGRRIFVKRVRAISSLYDCFLWLVAVAPFLTGFLAYRQWFDYRTMLIAHIIAGEAMLILIPFTKLGHMIYFFLYRVFIGSEYSFGQGRRAW
jgi:nitrate reductase gamma subunit